jgi:hypothetical protein
MNAAIGLTMGTNAGGEMLALLMSLAVGFGAFVLFRVWAKSKVQEGTS